jgi:hypothetical protein
MKCKEEPIDLLDIIENQRVLYNEIIELKNEIDKLIQLDKEISKLLGE